MDRIPLIKPYMSEAVKTRVLAVLDSGFLTEGPVTREFERLVAEYVGARRVLATTSCTTGLELALRCLGIGPGDEVIVPDYTYPATASAVNIVGATAVIVDVDPETLLIDYDALEAAVTEKTRAAMPVSLFGSPLDWDRLEDIKRRHGLFMIEDAACALGSSYKDRMTGAWADVSVFSHHPRKFITTGEGGTVCTGNENWADWMESYKHFGLQSQGGRLSASFVRVGTNYKMSDLLAAVGVEQMLRVDELLAERRRLAGRYHDLLADVSAVEIPRLVPGGEHSWQTYCVLVDDRDEIMAYMREREVEVQIGTYALHMHAAFQENSLCRIEGDMRGSASAFARTLALPLYQGMTEFQQQRVVEALARALRQHGNL